MAQNEFTEWDPAQILSGQSNGVEHKHALLILNQPIEDLDILKTVWENSMFRIAADGGANRLLTCFQSPQFPQFPPLSRNLDAICGDLDSLTSTVQTHFSTLGTTILKDPDQYSTDFTKCVHLLRTHIFPSISPASSKIPDIVCLGGLGGRVDQGMSQLHHLFMFQEAGNAASKVFLLSTEAITFVLKTGWHRVRVRPEGYGKTQTAENVPTEPNTPATTATSPSSHSQTNIPAPTETELPVSPNTRTADSAPRTHPKTVFGKHVGILPVKGQAKITTRGLEWDVCEWETRFGGQVSTSNHVREEVVEIYTTEDVLFTIDLELRDLT